MSANRGVFIFPNGEGLPAIVVEKALMFSEYLQKVYGDETLVNFLLICSGEEKRFRGNRAEELTQLCVRYRIGYKLSSVEKHPVKPLEVDEELASAVQKIVHCCNGTVQIKNPLA